VAERPQFIGYGSIKNSPKEEAGEGAYPHSGY